MSTFEEAKTSYSIKSSKCYRPVWNLGMFLWKMDFINGVPVKKSKNVIQDLSDEDLTATDWVIE